MIHDRVTDVGTGVDTAVRRISTVYILTDRSNGLRPGITLPLEMVLSSMKFDTSTINMAYWEKNTLILSGQRICLCLRNISTTRVSQANTLLTASARLE